MKTAVEQLAIALYEGGYLKGNGDEIQKLVDKAKEMEKEQRVDDYVNGMNKGQEIYFNHQIRLDVNSINYSTTIAENYYNETYGGKNEN
jgi:hypothetical protein